MDGAPLRNGRRERFAQLVAEGRSIADAYAEAGFIGGRANAYRLSIHPTVRGRIAELQKGAAMRAEISLASVTDNLMTIARAAEQQGDAPGLSVARAAWMDIAKLNGLLVDRKESVNLNYAVSDEPMTEEEWARQYALGNHE